MRKLSVLTSIVFLACGFAVAAYAQGDAAKEASTAHTHAQLSQDASSVANAHMHLHHVINCLVGPDGAAFDADAANPCKGQGNGAIPDAKGNDALTTKLQNALAHAQEGLQADKLDAVHKSAAEAAAALAVTPDEKSSGKYSW